jgi:hypothetical protein
VSFYVVYDPQGRILRSGTCPESMLTIQARSGESVMEVGAVLDDRLWRVDLSGADPLIVARPALPAFDRLAVTANGVDKATCAGLPNPTTVTVSGPATDAWVETDGVVEIAFGAPGAYRVRLDAGLAYQVREELIRGN